MDIVVIGDRNTATSFRLSGVKKVYGDDEGRQDLKQILSDEANGIVIVTERFAEDNRRLIDDHKESKRMLPIIVEVPDTSGPIERKEDPIRELIRRAIGADIQ